MTVLGGNEVYFSTLRTLLAQTPMQMPISGTCMDPLIRDTQVVTVAAARRYRIGDVLVVRAHDGRLYAHRLIFIYPKNAGWRYITRADNTTRADTAVETEQILGRLAELVGWRGRLRGWWGFTRLLGQGVRKISRLTDRGGVAWRCATDHRRD